MTNAYLEPLEPMEGHLEESPAMAQLFEVSPEELDFAARQNPEDYEAWDIPGSAGPQELTLGEDQDRGFQTFEPEDFETVYSLDRAWDPHPDIRDETWEWECSACGKNAAWAEFSRPGGIPIDWKPGMPGSNSLCCGAPMSPIEASSAVLIEWNRDEPGLRAPQAA